MKLRISDGLTLQIPASLYLAARKAVIESAPSDALQLRVGYALLCAGLPRCAPVGLMLWAATKDMQVLAEHALELIGQPVNALAASAMRATLEEPESAAAPREPEEEGYEPPTVTLGTPPSATPPKPTLTLNGETWAQVDARTKGSTLPSEIELRAQWSRGLAAVEAGTLADWLALEGSALGFARGEG